MHCRAQHRRHKCTRSVRLVMRRSMLSPALMVVTPEGGVGVSSRDALRASGAPCRVLLSTRQHRRAAGLWPRSAGGAVEASCRSSNRWERAWRVRSGRAVGRPWEIGAAHAHTLCFRIAHAGKRRKTRMSRVCIMNTPLYSMVVFGACYLHSCDLLRRDTTSVHDCFLSGTNQCISVMHSNACN